MIDVRREGGRLVVGDRLDHRGGKGQAKYPVGVCYPIAGRLSTLGVRSDHKLSYGTPNSSYGHFEKLYGHFERLMVMLIFVWSLYNKLKCHMVKYCVFIVAFFK